MTSPLLVHDAAVCEKGIECNILRQCLSDIMVLSIDSRNECFNKVINLHGKNVVQYAFAGTSLITNKLKRVLAITLVLGVTSAT